ncbi:response regulator [Acidovorax sp. SUPP950]|uniref:response regulator n=1 Tax=unclassified Acidovorax TaxID=2684926 RepID=UPI0023C75FEA|nr:MULTISPECIES: response regulator [Comamonadaceae]WOI45443.1 response regulator [Paracidovorax avenae]GKS77660.1 response regulator [Acidovorax sp. SUPP950]GKS87383.1 response regulator [Acidovorax sp. SUPP1855]
MTQRAAEILVVDDHPETAELAAMALQLDGFTAAIANSGADALNYIEKHQPACVLLDFDMPGMDGLELARRVRDKHNDDIVLIALTGWTDTNDRVTELLAVVDHHFLKPVDWRRLTGILSPLR